MSEETDLVEMDALLETLFEAGQHEDDERDWLAMEGEDIALAERALPAIDERLPAALKLAKAMPAGALRSAWLGPLERIVRERAHLLREAGEEATAVPKSMKADAHEKALPEGARQIYRRAKHLKGAAVKAVKARKARHAERAAAVRAPVSPPREPQPS